MNEVRLASSWPGRLSVCRFSTTFPRSPWHLAKSFDYIAASLPVVINYPGWLAEIVRASCGGTAVSQADPVAFAEALIHVTNHRTELPLMAHRARALGRGEVDRRLLAGRVAAGLEVTAAG